MDISRNHYREVLKVLEAGPKSSGQIKSQVGISDIDHCSAILAKLSSHKYISKAYVITEEGRKVLHPEAGPATNAPPREPTVIFRTSSAKKPFSIKMVGGLPQVVKERD